MVLLAACVLPRLVEDQHPLKQGLKHYPPAERSGAGRRRVEDQHPLKQGLKLRIYICSYRPGIVEDQHPLKQGLKPIIMRNLRVLFKRRRPTSTKTRIETGLRTQLEQQQKGRRPTSTKTRIETQMLL